MKPVRRSFLCAGASVALGAVLEGCSSADASTDVPPPYPQVADTSAASPELVAFMTSFYTAKSNRDLDKTMSHFATDMVTYLDAALGLDNSSWTILRGVFAQFMPTWTATAKSYPTRIIGDLNSAVVCFTDSPELFGGELRIIGAIDFKNGKVVRWVDHWDGRGWPNAFGLNKLPVSNYHTAEVGENASARMKAVGAKLAAALAAGGSSAAADLFTVDAVFEDMTLRSQVQGQLAISRYLARAASALPYGVGARARHVVGSDKGGAIEWDCASGSPVKTAVSALVLDDTGLISRLTTVYDGALYSAAQLQALSARSLEP